MTMKMCVFCVWFFRVYLFMAGRLVVYLSCCENEGVYEDIYIVRTGKTNSA